MSETIAVQSQPEKKQDVPIRQDPVARSISREDAFMKPASTGKPNARGSNAVRIRMSNPNPKIKLHKKKRDVRDVHFY